MEAEAELRALALFTERALSDLAVRVVAIQYRTQAPDLFTGIPPGSARRIVNAQGDALLVEHTRSTLVDHGTSLLLREIQSRLERSATTEPYPGVERSERLAEVIDLFPGLDETDD